jgi:ribonuclease J
LLPVDQIKDLPHHKVVILTTGSQGEPLSALSRIANDEHKQIKITPGDTVIISATPIPGNERLVANTINSLFLRGANVVYGREAGVHVSGHACKEEQKLMINLCKPKFFMPIHGEYRMLVKHAELAVQCGVDENNVFVMENGDVLEMTKDKGQKNGRIKCGIILVDSSRNWHINEAIVEERRHLSEDGLVTVAATINSKRHLLDVPQVSLRGVILPRGVAPEMFVNKVLDQINLILSDTAAIGKLSDDDLRSYMVGALNRFFSEKMRASPLVQVMLHIMPNQKAEPPAPSAKAPVSTKDLLPE